MCKLQSSSTLRLQLQSHADDHATEIASAEIGEPSSACLWAMVHDFLELDASAVACTDDDHISSTPRAPFGGCCNAETTLMRAIQEMEFMKESCARDVVVAKVSSCVGKALKSKSSVTGVEGAHNELALRGVLKHLRREGYNAGLCVTERKPGHATAFPRTGGHQFIDVIVEEKGNPGDKRSSDKLIVDLNFRSHFEIARPLPAYQKVMGLLPSTFVGKAMLLQRVVRIMSQAARASLESHDMAIPPWRSFSFLLAKWFSPSCSRLTSFDEAKQVVHYTLPFADRIELRVLAELNNYNFNSDSLVHPPVNNCRDGPKPLRLQKDAAREWYPPPPANQICINSNDSDDGSTKKRRQANVVSALTLAFAETQPAHALTECVAEQLHKGRGTIGLNKQQV